VGTVKVRPDHKLVIQRRWDTPKERLEGAKHVLKQFAALAREEAGAAS
jgi:transcription-repair coupling factor (superfamily II helicase)